MDTLFILNDKNDFFLLALGILNISYIFAAKSV